MELAGGRYKLEKVIGQGGFATVWRGFDSALAVHRAVKLLHPNLSGRAQFRERLRAEARTMARLAHPNVLTVHDIGEQDGQDWFVMDLVEGGSLGDWQLRGGPLPPGLAVGCAIQVLSALSAAHASGIVHRDVKPQNILLDADGRCRLADFGIALLESEELLRSTKTGATMGSLSYMAPEQRLSAKDVGPSADLYAVGSTLYALLTNANAIDLFTAAPSSARWNGVPECLRPILQRVTRHDPGARYRSAAELAQVLAVVQQELPDGRWEDWLAQVGASRNLAGPTLVLPTMDVMQRSTKHALTILEELGGSASPPTSVPSTQGAEETYYEPKDSLPVTSTVVEVTPGAAPTPAAPRAPAGVRWLALAAALLVGALGLWAWAPWQAAGPPTQPAPSAPSTDEAAPAATPPPSSPPEREAATSDPGEPADGDPVQPAPTTSQPDRAAKPEPVAKPTPAAQPEPTPPGAASSAVAGRWTGSYGGKDASLQLSGSDGALVGTLAVEFFGNVQTSRVRGSFVDGRLVLEDQDRSERYAGRHVGSVGDDRITGQTTTFADSRITAFEFRRR
jgi:serine/threonine protein kinase